MKITRKSILTGQTNILDIPVTQEQMDAWHSGILIQKAMPNLLDDEREFIMNGITKEEWNTEIGDEDEDEDKGLGLDNDL